MVDIHTHIIPNIDDGSKTIEETFELFREAQTEGFTDIILTPHYIKGYYETNTTIRNYWVNSIQEALKELGININVYVGNEIYVCEDMDKLLFKNEVSSLNNSKYVLFELPMNSNITYLEEVIFKLSNLDKIPIIAHPERYSFVQKDMSLIKKLHEKGVLFQSNYGSILGLYGEGAKKTVEKLLKEKMIDFLASDVHKQNTIYPSIEECKKRIKKIIGEDRLKTITETNPKKIILNESI